jgi:hypothetical protein
MRGIVVDFHTLYDPPALAGAILAYTPFYDYIYASKYSLLLEATPIRGEGFVPINGLRISSNDLNSTSMKVGLDWLQHWSKKNLDDYEYKVVRGNLFASLVLIKESIEAGLLKVLEDDDEYIRFGKKILNEKNFPTMNACDIMIPFGEKKENGFYLSPDLSISFQLGVGIVYQRESMYRFSTNNTIVEEALYQLLSSKENQTKRLRSLKCNWNTGQKTILTTKDVFKFIRCIRSI